MPQTMSKVTLKGNPVTLLGTEPQIGSSAPDAVLTANDLSAVKLSSYKGKKVILSVVPSLDTPVCDLQAKRFNLEAGKLGDDVAILVVSVDLPFAQKRWCGAAGADKVKTLSDYKNNNFGKAYGVLIEGVQILARSVFVVDANGVLRYKQIVPEVTTEPNYDEALKALKSL
ncbi:MAG: thiol peroxidase [Sedimentisphaerales bacterium]|nr:thiol peroxidase [Sedimentisphaerales bacterium]